MKDDAFDRLCDNIKDAIEYEQYQKKMQENAKAIAEVIDSATMETIKRRLDDWLMFDK